MTETVSRKRIKLAWVAPNRHVRRWDLCNENGVSIAQIIPKGNGYLWRVKVFDKHGRTRVVRSVLPLPTLKKAKARILLSVHCDYEVVT